MNLDSTIYLIAVLSGIFITLSIYVLYKLIIKTNKESFNNSDSKSNIKKVPTVPTTNTSNIQKVPIVSITNNALGILPKKSDNYILINTFNNAIKIKNNELRWYDDKVDINKILMTDFNKGSYFSLNNIITFVSDKLINNVKGAKLHNVQLNGPIAFYFSNKEKSPYILSEFSLLFMIKLNKIQGKSTLFEMLCNTNITGDDVYIPSNISIIIVEKNDRYFHIDIIFGSDKYRIKDLEKHLLINDTTNLIAMTFNSSNIVMRINNTPYVFNYKSNNTLTLGSLPVIINKKGKLDMILYSMAYYKKALTASDMTDFIKYNMYYFNGINKFMEEKKQYLDILQYSEENKQKMNEMSKILDKCISTKIDVSSNNVDTNVKKNLISHMETPYPSMM